MYDRTGLDFPQKWLVSYAQKLCPMNRSSLVEVVKRLPASLGV